MTFRYAIDKVLEIAIPFRFLEASPGTKVVFSVHISYNGEIIERFPEDGYCACDVPAEDFDKSLWEV